ncbi:MAG: alpha/beta hydrolase [Proteobacteria bacterium]|nr:alpha/beta hydrolase [Pseudomonadota bacterium]
MTAEEERFAVFPGAQAPDRRHTVDADGLQVAVHEWGDEGAPVLLLAHGGFDFAATYHVFAPLLAAGGYRVVAWDQRGHGDSQHPVLYSWDADARDALAVLDATTQEPAVFVGHSKGGSLLTHLAHACPHRVRALVNIDGLPSKMIHRDVADHERTRLLANDLASWLDHRRRAASKSRRPGTLEELARRRARMNPRLSHEWLCYLVSQGGTKSADGWRWKIDPTLRMGGFGPWRPIWATQRLPGLSVPLLGILGMIHEEMGWDTTPEDLAPYLPARARIVPFDDAGHFVHIEQPEAVAELVLEFLS